MGLNWNRFFGLISSWILVLVIVVLIGSRSDGGMVLWFIVFTLASSYFLSVEKEPTEQATEAEDSDA